ncbi:MAG TPA: tandem-95 repeat protein, partial [Burkholderiaceae bacterium]
NPTAANDAFSATENGTTGTLSVKTNDTAVAGETNTWSVASTTTAHGTITPAADFATSGKFTYTPTTGFSGTDSFTYTITDGSGHTSTATVTINVAPINPVATADTFAATENATTGTLNLASNDTPVAGETNTWSVASTATTHGTITPAADFATSGKFTYTPNSGFSGTDTFAYTITDGSGQTSTATVTINVAAINPTAANDAFTVTQNGASPTLSVKSNDTPVSGETNTWAVKTNPTHGTLTPAADFATTGNFTYTSNNNYTGTDTFTYTITDGSGHTSTATVTLTVVKEFAPVATADTYTATENTLLVLNGAAGAANHAPTTNDTDSNGDALTVTKINGATFDATHPATITSGSTTAGTLTMDANGVISFNPATNFTGSASFTYTISDGHGGTSTATDTITVSAGTDEPTVSVSSVGRWLFNENTGTSTTDAYNGNTGTLKDVNTGNGGTIPTWSSTGHNALSGSALNFDGKGAIVALPTAATDALVGTSTLSVWFNTTQTGTSIGWSSPSIIGTESAGDGNDIQWGALNSSGQIGFGLGNLPTLYSTQAVNDGTWHDLTITRTVNANGTSVVSIYIDGALSSSGTFAADPGATSGMPSNKLVGFGFTNGWSSSSGDTTTGDVYYKGALDDAHIYNHALTADQAKAVYNVENGYQGQAVANDGDAIKLAVTDTHATALHVIGVEAGMTISDGAGHSITATSNSQVIDITGWTLGGLQLTNVGTGSANLEFDAINVNGSQSEDTSTYVSVVNGTSLLGGTSGSDTLGSAGATQAMFISGGAGDDSLTGGSGNDRLLGGTGNDVFRWEFGDQGSAGTPYVDTINDFSSSAGNKDVLDMRDLLGGASHTGNNPGNIASFLHFDHSGADTIIHVSTTGGFAGGYSAAVENETIVLKGVDLTANGTQTDAQIITQLLTNGQLHLG